MRVLACTILTIGTVLVAAPACAQTYDPNYPFASKSTVLAAAISTAAL
jgi:hypothetical protein